VPKLLLESDDDRRRFAQGEERHRQRLAEAGRR